MAIQDVWINPTIQEQRENLSKIKNKKQNGKDPKSLIKDQQQLTPHL